MTQVTKLVVPVLLSSAIVLGCGGSQAPAEAPVEAPAPPPAGEPSTPPTDSGATRPDVTAEECEAHGGAVVGDIGDGAIHRPDYRCPGGAAPSGNIRAPGGGPIAIEGSVCCPK